MRIGGRRPPVLTVKRSRPCGDRIKAEKCQVVFYRTDTEAITKCLDTRKRRHWGEKMKRTIWAAFLKTTNFVVGGDYPLGFRPEICKFLWPRAPRCNDLM